MPQIVHTSNYGDITFAQTFRDIAEGHVGRLMNGAYCHYNGRPIEDWSELEAVLSKAAPLEVPRAKTWWDKQLASAGKEEEYVRGIMLTADDRIVFMDNPDEEVNSLDAILAATQPGTRLREMALQCFHEHMQKSKKRAARKATDLNPELEPTIVE